MSSDSNIQVEPHVLNFIRQIDEPSGALAQRPLNLDPPETPTLRRTVRKLSEPAHKSLAPIKPILKGKKTSPGATGRSGSSQPSHPSPTKNNIPLRFTTRKAPPPVTPTITKEVPNSAGTSESGDELFYTPGSVRVTFEGDDKDYLTSQQQDENQSNRDSETFFKAPPTPPPTPSLRMSFSEDVSDRGYPLTPQNTSRGKRRTTPIVDELDRLRKSLRFPSRQSFAFSPPSEAPPGETPKANDNVQGAQQAPELSQPPPASGPSRHVSWRPTFTRRSQEKVTPQHPEPVRGASKRKSVSEPEASSKRRKTVQFDIPPERREHPPLKRRPTPYLEPFSAKVRRIFRNLVAPFFKTKEEKEQEKAHKETKKAAKRARKEREELVESFRHFDDTVD